MTGSARQQPDNGWKLETYGMMREAIGMGQYQGRVTLGKLAREPHFFGVGALEGLSGEFTIHDGKVYVSTVNQCGNVTTASDEQAPRCRRRC